MRLCVTALATMTLLAAASAPGLAGKFNRRLDVGDPAPKFENVDGVDGKRHSLSDYDDKRLVVLCVICNHCPCVRAYEERLIRLQMEYGPRGVQFVAINPNRGGLDSLDAMKERAEKSGFNFPYLHDPDRQATKAYGALVTPTVFLLDEDRKVAYMGAIDDNQDESEVEYRFLADALEALLAGKRPEFAETRAVGCPIPDEE